MSRPCGRIEFKAATRQEQTAELLVYGNIGDAWWEDESVSSKAAVQAISSAKAGGATRIKVRINSRGGIVNDGVAIFNALRNAGLPITTVVEGCAASIAGLIFMAGDVRLMGDTTTLMHHAPWSTVDGNAAELRRAADVLDKIAESMVPAYMRSGKSRADVLSMLQDGADHWFTASEAVAEGYATAIDRTVHVDDMETQAAAYAQYRAPSRIVAAHARANAMRSAPNALQAERRRLADVVAFGNKHKLNAPLVNKAVMSGWSVDRLGREAFGGSQGGTPDPWAFAIAQASNGVPVPAAGRASGTQSPWASAIQKATERFEHGAL